MSATENKVTLTPVQKFQEKVAKERKRYDAIVAWNLLAHVDAGIELPYNGDCTYNGVTVQEYDATTGDHIVDEDATVKILAKVIKYARKRGYKVEKNYNHNFEVRITISGRDDPAGWIQTTYYAQRESVCTAKVVGQEVVPGYTEPEKVVDKIEWECSKLSFLGVDTD